MKTLLLSACLCLIMKAYTQTNDTLARPVIFEDAFSNDTINFNSYKKPNKFLSFPIGELELKTGKLIVCDGMEIHIAKPLDKLFPKGQFPVEIAINQDDDTIDSSWIISYCRIKFSNQPVKKWKKVKRFNDTVGKMSAFVESSFYTHDLGAYVSVVGESAAIQKIVKSSYSNWARMFINPFKEKEKKAVLEGFRNREVFKFDGYPLQVFIGFDKEGKIARLLVDTGNCKIPLEWY